MCWGGGHSRVPASQPLSLSGFWFWLSNNFKSGVIPVLVTLPKCLSPALAEMHLQALKGRLQSCPLLGKFSPRRTQKEIHQV